MKTTLEMRSRIRELSSAAPGADDYDRAVHLLLDDFDQLEKLVYVPGVLKCAKCGFGLIKTNLHVRTGNFSANNEPDYCPNDGAPLWRVTERDAGNEMIDRASEMSDELLRLRAAMTAVRDDGGVPLYIQTIAKAALG